MLGEWVDFTIDAKTFNLTGGHSISLSELMAKLGVKDFDISKVKNVTFTNPELLSITNTGSDWLLTSIQPFQTNERLVIEMVDGSKITIEVTDAIEDNYKENAKDFSNYITSAVVKKLVNGEWIVPADNKFTDGDQVSATLNFHIPAGVVTNDHPTISYQLPNGIKPIEATSGIVYRGTTPVGTYEIGAGGKIYIKYYDEFATGAAFDGDITFQGTVSRNDAGKGGEIVFPGNGGKVIVEPGSTQYDMNTTKTVDGEINKTDSNNWKANYKVTVSTTRGTDPDQKITITDAIDGRSTATGQYDSTSFKLYKYDAKGNKTEVTGVSPSITGNKFTYTNLPALGAGEKYEVDYTMTNIKAKPKDQGGTADGSSHLINNAGATSGDINAPTQKDLEVTKSSVSKGGWYNSSTRSIDWTITINQDRLDINGKKFTDTLPESLELSKLPTDTDGRHYVELKNTDDPNNPIKIYVGKDRKIEYTFGANSNHKYTIQYSTPVDEKKLGSDRNVTNTATFNGNDASATVNIPENDWNVNKSFTYEEETATNVKYHWSTNVNIKDSIDQTNGFTVTDTIESAVVDGTTVYHYANIGDLKTALKNNITVTDANGTNVTEKLNFTYTFWGTTGNDFANIMDVTNEGWANVTKFSIKVTSKEGTPVDATTLTISDYTTLIDPTLAKKGVNYPMNNTAQVGTKTSTASHNYYIPVPIKKYIQTAGNPDTPSEDTNKYSSGDAVMNLEDAIINKNGKHILTYSILVDPLSMLPDGNGAYNGFSLTDTLPSGTSLLDGSLKFYVSKDGRLTNVASNITNYTLPSDGFTFGENSSLTKAPVTVTKGNSNGQQTLTIQFAEKDANNNDLRENAEKAKTDQILIRYSVVIDDNIYKDATVTTHKFTNTVEWQNVGTISQNTNVDRNYEKVRKTGTQRKDEAGNPQDYIDYNIIVNPKGEDLSPATDTIKLEDDMQNQTTWNINGVPDLDLTSVKVYHYDPSQDTGIGQPLDNDLYTVKYDDSDTTNYKRVMNMVLPDKMPLVVIYTYKINRKNDASSATFTNSISLNGKTAATEDTVLKEITSGSTASRQFVTFYKMDSQTFKLLSGATFKIEYWSKTDSKWKMLTGYDRYTIQQAQDGKWNNTIGPTDDSSSFQTDVLYRIQETNAPTGYTLNSDYYYFLFNGTNNNTMEDDNTAKGKAYNWDTNNTKIGQSDVKCIGSSGGNIQILDDSTGIKAKKIWVDQHGNEFTPKEGSVEVKLIQHSSSDIEIHGYTVNVYVVNKDTKDMDNPIQHFTYNVSTGSNLNFDITGDGGDKTVSIT